MASRQLYKTVSGSRLRSTDRKVRTPRDSWLAMRTPRHVLFLCVVVCLVLQAKGAGRISQRDNHQIWRVVHHRRMGCEGDAARAVCDGRLTPGPGLDEENCIHKCLSAPCYDAVYASEPVRVGETQARSFALHVYSCLEAALMTLGPSAAISALFILTCIALMLLMTSMSRLSVECPIFRYSVRRLVR